MSKETENEIEAIIGELEDFGAWIRDHDGPTHFHWRTLLVEIERRIDLLKEHQRTEKGEG